MNFKVIIIKINNFIILDNVLLDDIKKSLYCHHIFIKIYLKLNVKNLLISRLICLVSCDSNFVH